MADVLQLLGSGILVGLVYALLGLGVVIVFRASEAFNFAVGEFLVVGAFLVLVAHSWLGLPILIALPVALLAAGAVGGLIERLTIKPPLGEPISTTIVTLGLAACCARSSSCIRRLPIPGCGFRTSRWRSGTCVPRGPWENPLARHLRPGDPPSGTRWGRPSGHLRGQAKALAFGINAGFVLLLVRS
jgi:branched-subunit amino acid ABC-type transport system permease component